jgi:hypothetical protein
MAQWLLSPALALPFCMHYHFFLALICKTFLPSPYASTRGIGIGPTSTCVSSRIISIVITSLETAKHLFESSESWASVNFGRFELLKE